MFAFLTIETEFDDVEDGSFTSQLALKIHLPFNLHEKIQIYWNIV